MSCHLYRRSCLTVGSVLFVGLSLWSCSFTAGLRYPNIVENRRKFEKMRYWTRKSPESDAAEYQTTLASSDIIEKMLTGDKDTAAMP